MKPWDRLLITGLIVTGLMIFGAVVYSHIQQAEAIDSAVKAAKERQTQLVQLIEKRCGCP